jgi:cell division protein FtsL
VLLFAAAAAITVGTAILSTAAAMYEARQETRRREIECRSADTIAAALAGYIDSMHRPP